MPPLDLPSAAPVATLPTIFLSATVTSKGQVTIPIEIREKLGLLPNCEVVFEIDREDISEVHLHPRDMRAAIVIALFGYASISPLQLPAMIVATRDGPVLNVAVRGSNWTRATPTASRPTKSMRWLRSSGNIPQ